MKVTNLSFAFIMTALIAVVALTAVFALSPGEKAPNFQLKDQFGKQWNLSDLQNRVVVVVAADKHSGEAMGPWVDGLKAKYSGKIQLLGLLDLHDIPSIGRGIAKSRIKNETSDPMMIDFNGNTAKSYNVSSNYPVVVVIDKTGVVKSVQMTQYNDAAFKAVTTAIDNSL